MEINGTEYSIKMVRDKQYLGNLLYKLMQLMFKGNDGHMYRWESEDLVNARMIFQLTVAEIRDYITPNITFVKKQCNVFGVRFGFVTNPVRWKQQQHFQKKWIGMNVSVSVSNGNQKAVDSMNVSVSVSNSKGTSGKLEVAGYISLKAPNTTHWH